MIKKIFIISFFIFSVGNAKSLLEKKEIEPGVITYTCPSILDYNSCMTRKDAEAYNKAALEYDSHMDEIRNELHESYIRRNKKKEKQKNLLIK